MTQAANWRWNTATVLLNGIMFTKGHPQLKPVKPIGLSPQPTQKSHPLWAAYSAYSFLWVNTTCLVLIEPYTYYLNVYIYVHTYILQIEYTYVYTMIYTYIERERETSRFRWLNLNHLKQSSTAMFYENPMNHQKSRLLSPNGLLQHKVGLEHVPRYASQCSQFFTIGFGKSP